MRSENRIVFDQRSVPADLNPLVGIRRVRRQRQPAERDVGGCDQKRNECRFQGQHRTATAFERYARLVQIELRRQRIISAQKINCSVFGYKTSTSVTAPKGFAKVPSPPTAPPATDPDNIFSSSARHRKGASHNLLTITHLPIIRGRMPSSFTNVRSHAILKQTARSLPCKNPLEHRVLRFLSF